MSVYRSRGVHVCIQKYMYIKTNVIAYIPYEWFAKRFKFRYRTQALASFLPLPGLFSNV